MIPDRAPTTIWCLNRDNFGTYVTTEVNDLIRITGPDWAGALASVCVSRRDARLLAKRINQCLDSTAKR